MAACIVCLLSQGGAPVQCICEMVAREQDWRVRCQAADALGLIGPAAATIADGEVRGGGHGMMMEVLGGCGK